MVTITKSRERERNTVRRTGKCPVMLEIRPRGIQGNIHCIPEVERHLLVLDIC